MPLAISAPVILGRAHDYFAISCRSLNERNATGKVRLFGLSLKQKFLDFAFNQAKRSYNRSSSSTQTVEGVGDEEQRCMG